MRTTLDLDTDILTVAKHVAAEKKQSIGKVISDMVRTSLQPNQNLNFRCAEIPVLPRKSGAKPVTSQIIKDLMELDGHPPAFAARR